jgi:hypothetical protein
MGNIEANIFLKVHIPEITAEIKNLQIISLIGVSDFFGGWSSFKPLARPKGRKLCQLWWKYAIMRLLRRGISSLKRNGTTVS